MTDFRVITHGPELRVVHVSSGAELGLRRAQSQIEVVEDEDPCRLPISHARSVVAHVLMTLVPRFRAACEAMIQAGALVPRGAATLPYLRLFTELEPQLSLWENGAPPPIVSAQRACRDRLGRVPKLLTQLDPHRHRALLADIHRWPSATYAVLIAEEADDPVAAMQDWQGLFSPTRSAYRSLSRTLMNLPDGVPLTHLVQHLPKIRLLQPAKSALELLLILATVSEFESMGVAQTRPQRIRRIRLASDEEIKRALAELGSIGRLLTSTWGQCCYLAQCLAFAPDSDQRLSGVVRSLIRRDREWAQQQARAIRVERAGGMKARLPHPPHPLPELEGLRFLPTVADILEEADSMHHCVDTYLDMIRTGEMFIFHADRHGERATAALSRTMVLTEVKGPLNEHNAACDWARESLTRWISAAAGT